MAKLSPFLWDPYNCPSPTWRQILKQIPLIFQFYYLKTQNARRQLCSRHLANPTPLSGLQTSLSHTLGAWYPAVVRILELPASASGIRIPTILNICLPKKLDNFSPQDHGFLTPAPLLRSFIWHTTKHLHVLRKDNRKMGQHSNIATTWFGLVSDNIKYGTNS